MHVFMGNPREMKHRGQQLIRTYNGRKPAIVFFDIDDTLLDASSSSDRRQSFMAPISSILDLYQACRRAGLLIVIITARPDYPYNRQYTENELQFHCIDYDLLYMCPEYMKDIAHFKKVCRRDALQRLKCQPLFAIGDRDWDFGEYGGTGLWIQ